MEGKPISRWALFGSRTASSWHYLRQNFMIAFIKKIRLFYNTGVHELSSPVTKILITLNN